jgi:hypothetical protein
MKNNDLSDEQQLKIQSSIQKLFEIKNISFTALEIV